MAVYLASGETPAWVAKGKTSLILKDERKGAGYEVIFHVGRQHSESY